LWHWDRAALECPFGRPDVPRPVQVAADLIIEKANPKAVIFSAREAMRKQCDARIARNLIGLLRREADATDDPDAIEHLSSFELFRHRRRIISQKEILGDIRDEKPAFVLLIDDKALARGDA